MRISVEKTKILAVERQVSAELLSIMLQDQSLEEVESFPYLGSEVGQLARGEKVGTVKSEQGKNWMCIRR